MSQYAKRHVRQYADTLMAEGRSNAAIARRLSISDGAVAKHATAIFAKLDLRRYCLGDSLVLRLDRPTAMMIPISQHGR